MDFGGDLPVTLVIKAPNQRIDDQTVDCMLGWTVKKLKEHLKTVYPNKPSEKQQKLIYSGKLLADHLTLKEVLRQFDDGTNRHTVHLVCSPTYMAQNYPPEKESQPRSQSSQPTVEPVQDTTGLRYRGNSPSNQSAQPQQPSQGNPVNPNVFGAFNQSGQFSQMPQFPAGFPTEAAAAMYGGMIQGTGMAYTPEQYMWMQQAYAQYMAQYMQYYHQAGYQMQSTTQGTGVGNEPNGGNQQNVENNNQQEAPAAGGDVEEGDEEFGQRDWLDYLYTFSRLMVLLGIVYFYSNLTRFIMVAVFFAVVYFYQMGWLMWRPRRRNVQQQQQQQQQEQPQQQQENIEQPENTETPTSDSTDSPPAPPEQPQEPGALKITWTFISTFFTSLFPSPPPPVNVN